MTVYYPISDELKPLEDLTADEAVSVLSELTRAAQHASTNTVTEIAELAQQLAARRDSANRHNTTPAAEPEDRCRDPFDENCRAPLDDGEGWDGACGNCADRLENENENDN